MDGERFAALVQVMRRLLGPDGCPWDRAQTPKTMRPFVIEEAFEVVEAIDAGSPDALREELGDLLMQVVFLGELAAARGWFTTDDAIDGIRDKLVRRHPHVFGDATAEPSRSRGASPPSSSPRTSEKPRIALRANDFASFPQEDAREVLRNWEAIKKEEKKGRGLLEGVPVSMPALLRAVAVGEKAARVGYDWPDAEGARDKIDEELAELDAANDEAAEAEELGDLLFAIASWSRKRGHDPEAALRGALRRFGERMATVEAGASRDGVELESLDAEELDRRWEAAKAST